MGYSNILNTYLNIILGKLTSNQNLCKLLYYSSADPLSQTDISNTSQLVNSIIIPKPFIPVTNDTAKSFLMVYYDSFNFDNNAFKDGYIIFDVISHETLWQIKNGIRVLSMMDEVENTFNAQKIIGVGRMQLVNQRQLWVNDQYKGYSERFRFTDFQSR